MDWIVFGDDWGGHPSTTQHLVLSLPKEDRVVWVDSIGMRAPRLCRTDIKRLWQKARAFVEPAAADDIGGIYKGQVSKFCRVKPKVLPFHQSATTVRLNGSSLGMAIRKQCSLLRMREPVVLSATPVVSLYLNMIPHVGTAYLRLDDYLNYPGVDAQLVKSTEKIMMSSADAVFATSQALLPTGVDKHKGIYLPQGVEIGHFAKTPLVPTRERILGFFGTIAEWLDFELIKAVAEMAPEWILEFIGKRDYLPHDTRNLKNVRFVEQVPFGELPKRVSSWACAWVPFRINRLTVAVNPLKIREYLAAGLPSHCTPLPEVCEFDDRVLISSDPEIITDWMEQMRLSDTAAARALRRGSVEKDSWKYRADMMRNVVKKEIANKMEPHF